MRCLLNRQHAPAGRIAGLLLRTYNDWAFHCLSNVWRDCPLRRALPSHRQSVRCVPQPVCTTEIGRLALKYKELESKGVKLATLSCDPVSSHQKWLDDVVAHCENKVSI